MLTSDTPDIPDVPDIPDIPDIQEEAAKRFFSTGVQKNCFRRTVQEELLKKKTFEKTWFRRRSLLTSDTPDIPDILKKKPSGSLQQWLVVKPRFSTTTTSERPSKQVAKAWKLTATTQPVYGRNQNSDERR